MTADSESMTQTTDTTLLSILARLEALENENTELKVTIAEMQEEDLELNARIMVLEDAAAEAAEVA